MSMTTSVSAPEVIENIDSINLKPDISKLATAQERFMNEQVKKNPELLRKIIGQWDFGESFRSFLQVNFPDLARELKKMTLYKVDLSGVIPENIDKKKLQEDEQKLIVRNATIDALWKNEAIEPIRMKAIEHTIALSGKREKILNDLKQYFSLGDQESKIKSAFENMSLETLDHAHRTISEWTKSRVDYLKNLEGVDIKKLEPKFASIEKAPEATVSADTPESARKKFYLALKKARRVATSEELYQMITATGADWLTPNEQKSLLREFVPSISLLTLIKMSGNEELKKEDVQRAMIRSVLEKQLSVGWATFTLPDNFLIDQTILDNIMISTTEKNTITELPFDHEDIIKIIWKNEKLLAPQKNAAEELIEHINQATLGELAELQLEPVGPEEKIHDQFIKKAAHLPNAHNLSSLQEGGYIMVNEYDPKTQVHSVYYYKVHKVDVGNTVESKTIELVRLTGPNGSIEKEPRVLTESRIDRMSYAELYEALKYGWGWLTINFFDPTTFKGYIQEEKIEEYPDFSENGEIESIEDLKKWLDLEDSEGAKYGISEGTCFDFGIEWDEKGKGTCRITKIDPEKKLIELTNGSKSSFSFIDFYVAFKALKAKRIAKFTNTDTLLQFLQQSASDDVKKAFKDVAIKDGVFMENKKDDAPKIELLLGKDDKIITIDGWKGDEVKMATGILDEEKGEKDKKTDTDTAKRTKKLDHEPQWVKIESLYSEIKKIDAKPFKQPKSEIPTKVEEVAKPNRKFSLAAMFESGISIAQLGGIFKYGKDPILNWFKRNDEEHSAELALKLYGRFMPEDIRKNFEKKIDKAREDNVKKFKDMITGWPHIRKMLLKSNIERYELEGILLYTMEKAGTLYPEKLSDLQYEGGKPTYLWYRALGGTPGDKLYMAIKRECETNKNAQGEDDPIPFTEERLVEKLLKTQGSDVRDFKDATKDRAKYGIKYKSRGGVDKEYSIAKANGIKAWVEDGEKKISDEVTVAGKLKSIISALKDGKYAAAFGWLSKFLESHGKREEMYKASIIIALSGIWAKLDKEVTAKLPGFGKYPYPPLLFMTSPGDITIFQDTCLDLADSIKARDGLKKALGETDMKKRFEELDKFLSAPNGKKDNISLLAELLSGHDEKHEIFSKRKENRNYYQFYDKIADKTKEHRTNTDAADKRVYTKKHSSLFWYDQTGDSIGTLHLDNQTTDLSDDNANNKKFKDALEIFKDVSKAAKNAKTDDEKKALKAQFEFVFERVYLPARWVIQSRRKNRSELRFVTKMKEAGLDLMATSDWTPDMTDAKSTAFKNFVEEQWKNLISGKRAGWSAASTTATTTKKIAEILKSNRKPNRRKQNSIEDILEGIWWAV